MSALTGRLAALGQGSTFVELSSDALAGTPVVWPPIAAQRAIADYLDRETARIDALIKAKKRMVELLKERAAAEVEQAIRGRVVAWGDTPLKFGCREVVVGIVITPAAWYADSGVPAIRGTNVSAGRFDLTDLVYLTAEGDALHSKSRLRQGDVVVVRTGQAGAAAVVPASLDGANCIDLVIVRPRSVLDPYFLEFVLNSDWTQKHIAEHSVGTIQSHFNVGAAKNLPIPVGPIHEQRALVERLRTLTDQSDRSAEALQRSVALLHERRLALITSAVTAELDIPAA